MGRDGELAAIDRALDDAAAGETATLVITGEAGIGKSRLLGALRDRAEARGGLALVGHTPIAGTSRLPYAVFIDALRPLPDRADPRELEALLGQGTRDLARLIPSIATSDMEAAVAAADASEWTRLRTFEAVAGLLERASLWRAPLVLALEDLHWADRSSVDLLAYLLRVLRSAPLLIAATVRTDDPAGPNEDVTRLLGEIERDDRVVILRPATLDGEALADMASHVHGGRPSRTLVDALLRRSDGNPFYAEALLAFGGADEAIPATLRDIVLGRLAGLPDPVRRLLRIAAVAGLRFEYPLLRASSDAEGDFVDEALRQGVARSVLSSASGPWGLGFTFRHELVREALEAELLPNEWLEAHRRLAAGLVSGTVSREAPGLIAARIARHWLAAGEEARALPALVKAGRSAEESGGYPEAAAQYRTAIEIWDRLDLEDPELPPEAGIDRIDLLRRAAEVDALSGDMSEAVRHGRGVVDLVERSDDPWAAAVAQARLARFLWQSDRHAEAISAYQAADGAIDAAVEVSRAPAPQDVEAQRARVLAAYARALLGTGHADDALPIAERALAAALGASARAEESQARTSLGLVLLATGDHDRAVTELASARRLLAESSTADGRPRPSRILSLVANFADLASGLGDGFAAAGGDDAASAGAELSRRLGVEGTSALRLVVQQARRAFNAGDWDEVDRLAREAGIPGTGPSSAGVGILALRARVATGRAEFAEAAEHLDAAFALLAPEAHAHDSPYWAAAAELALWRGRLDDAHRAVERGLASRPEQHDVEATLELLALGARVQAERHEAARAGRTPAQANDAREEAEALRAQAVALVERAPGATPVAVAWLSQVEAEAARASGSSDPARWSETVDRWDAAGRPWSSAYARWQLADALSTTKGSRERLRDILGPALETARRLGAVRLTEEIDALARRSRTDLGSGSVELGDRAAEGSGRRRSGEDGLGLSERELEVLALVAEGRTNRQIATELFITEKTAGHHVSNVLSKLGAASRTEAAAIAHRAGALGASRES